MNTPSAQQIEILTQWDTPTVCNALELVMPERRGFGFTVEQAVCLAPDLKPVIGYARTVRCATRTPPQESPEDPEEKTRGKERREREREKPALHIAINA